MTRTLARNWLIGVFAPLRPYFEPFFWERNCKTGQMRLP